MWRFLYIIYAIVITVATTAIHGGSGIGGSYRSWGGSSYGSGYSGGGSFHK